MPYHLVGLIDYLNKIEVLFRYLSIRQHGFLYPVHKPTPVFASHKDYREASYPLRLNKGKGLKEFIHCAESPGKDNIGHGILDKHDLPNKEIFVSNIILA